MDPDRVRAPSRTSGDNEAAIEWHDLQKIVKGVEEDEWNALYLEYSQQTVPIDGPKYGRNKLEGLRQRCGRQLTVNDYIRLVQQGLRKVTQNLFDLGWCLPKP
jgi:hypothetical protein